MHAPSRSVVLMLFTTLLTTGCLGQLEGGQREAGTHGALGELGLEGEADANGRIQWTLENASNELVTVGSETPGASFPVLRVEALQGDGSWTERNALILRGPARRTRRELWSHQSVSVGTLYDLGPGTYRLLARAESAGGPIDVVRELAIVGWSEDTLEEGQALRERAQGAGCHGVARRISEDLLSNVEPDLVLDLLRDANMGTGADQDASQDTDQMGRERWRVLTEMVRRGAFVSELSDEVERMSTEDAVSFAGLISQRNSNRDQVLLRAAVANRLMEPFTEWETPLAADLLRELSFFEDQWPAHAPDTLIARLADGPEANLALAELINVVAYGSWELFNPDSDDILVILEGRCRGVTGEELTEACDRGLARFSPGFNGGFGRGYGTSSGCGGGWGSSAEACVELARAWRVVTEEVGAPGLVFLSTSVEPVAGLPEGSSSGGEHSGGLIFPR